MFVKNNARIKALFAGLVLLVMAGSLFISCTDAGSNNDPVNAQQPSITGQPIGGNWNVTTDATFHLAVTASVTDGGTLSYQWYSNTANTATGGTAIGTNSKDIHLDKADYTEGEDYHFYVVVTNTNNSVDGNKTAARTSSVVKVEVRTTGITEGNPEEGDDDEWEWDLPAGLNGFFQTEYDNLMYYSYDTDISGYIVDGFFIDPASKKFDYYFDTSLEYGWGGTIVNHVPGEDNSEVSVLIIEVDWAEKNTASPFADYITLPDTGKFFAYSYKNIAPWDGTTSLSSAAPFGDNMTGTATIQEAITEYTAENSYYSTFGLYIKRTVTPAGLENLKGDWWDGDDDGFFILIRGTGISYFLEDEDSDIGVFEGEDEMSGVIGIIVDYTDPVQDSGVLYIQVIESDFGFTAKKYVAFAWRNKDGDSIDFMICTEEEGTIAAVKEAYPDASNTYFADSGFDPFER